MVCDHKIGDCKGELGEVRDITQGAILEMVSLKEQFWRVSGSLNPIAYGGGGLFGPRHQTVSHNSRTLSSRLPKLSDFSFLLFGHIVAKFQVN